MEKLTNNVHDVALVFEGGGYRASYTAAFANALLQNHIYFDYVCGLSAGASNTVDYLSRDQERTRLAFAGGEWVRGSVGLGSLVRGNGYFNADNIYEGAVETGKLPFDWETFSANPARLRIQAFDRDTGRTLRFGREDMPDVARLMALVRASSTLPGAMIPEPVDGRILYDGGLGEGAGIPLCMAEADGFERFIFLATRPRGYRKSEPTRGEAAVYKRLAADHPYMRNALLTRWERYNAELERVEALAEEGRCLIIYPDEMIVSSGTVNEAKLHASYELGRRHAVREMPQIREFIWGEKDAGPAPEPGWDGYITIG